MKSLAEHMAVYAAYHRHPTNRAIHFVFVPAIVWTLMVALDHVSLGVVAGVPLTAAMAVTGALLVWYLRLDFQLGLAATAVFTVLLVLAVRLNAAVGLQTSLTVAAVLFVASWVFQFVGHGVWEKRRPALVDNLFQVFVAPMFLVAETAFGLGLRGALRAEVRTRMVEHLPSADDAGASQQN